MFFFAVLFVLANGQSSSDCVYHQGGLELNLFQLKGKLLMQQTATADVSYSVCSNSLSCVNGDGSVQAMVEGHKIGINECHYLAISNTSVQPFYDIATASWVFNYSNGEPCSMEQQINTSTLILWTCNEDAEQPFFTDLYEYDACNFLLQVQWEGACVPAPPNNEKCEFYGGINKFLNLSTIKGQTLVYTDSNNLEWQFTPCANNLNCVNSHGSNIPVMADINDPDGHCVKFLGVWAGDAVPFYDRTIIGDDYWDFFWLDGEECSAGGPLQNLNVRYYCSPATIGAKIRTAGGVGPCAFRIEIDSNLACLNHTSTPKDTMHKLNGDIRQKIVERLDIKSYQ